MNPSLVDRIARAVLYERYILYPYRPSVKNRQRWTSGGLYPAASSQVRESGDASMMQTECLVSGRHPVIDVRVRCLHVMNRRIGEGVASTSAEVTRFVETLSVGDRQYVPWQEAVEREVCVGQGQLQLKRCSH